MVEFSDIIKAVSEHRGIPKEDILSACRLRPVAHARQEVAYLASEMTNASLSRIGQRLGRDHTSILHGIRAVRKRAVDDEYFKDMVAMREAVLPRFVRHNNNLQFTTSRKPKK